MMLLLLLCSAVAVSGGLEASNSLNLLYYLLQFIVLPSLHPPSNVSGFKTLVFRMST